MKIRKFCLGFLAICLLPQLFFSARASSQTSISSLRKYYQKKDIYSKSLVRRIKDGHVVSSATVELDQKNRWQSLEFYVTGLNDSSCRKTLRKTRQYEEFKNYFSYVKKSDYNEANKNIYLFIESKLLPVPMILDFKISRVDAPGTYPYTFEKGVLKGLQGTITVLKHGRSCMVFSDGKWKGTPTKFASTIIEIFTETLSKISLERLFRLSRR